MPRSPLPARPVLVAVAALVPALAGAQATSAPGDTTPRPAPAGSVPASATAAPASPIPGAAAQAGAIADTIEAGLAARALAAIQGERDHWLVERREAETRWAVATARAQALRSEIVATERAAEAALQRARAARKEKRDTDRAAADAERARLERTLNLLRARRDLTTAEGEQARLEREHADAAVRAADAEQAIADRRQVASHADPVQRLAFEELQARWLLALRTREARNADVADRRLRVVEARQALLERERKR